MRRIENVFLVELKPDEFLSDIRAGVYYKTPFPTAAAQFDFETATELSRRLRLSGFPEAVVVNSCGQLPTPRELAKAREEAAKFVVIVDGKFFFTGQQVGKHERLTADIKDALQLSRKVAEGIREKLRGTGLRNVQWKKLNRKKYATEEVERFGEMCPRNASCRRPCKPLPRPTQNRNWSKWQSARKSHERRNTFSRGLQ